MQVKATYRTSDFTEICFLMAQSIPLIEAERDGERVTFVFDDSSGICGAMVSDFCLGRDQVSATRLLHERARALKIIRMT